MKNTLPVLTHHRFPLPVLKQDRLSSAMLTACQTYSFRLSLILVRWLPHTLRSGINCPNISTVLVSVTTRYTARIEECPFFIPCCAVLIHQGPSRHRIRIKQRSSTNQRRAEHNNIDTGGPSAFNQSSAKRVAVPHLNT